MSSSTPRAIDAIPPRDASSKKMEVLCLGLPRTGTMSTKVALTMLGYRAYHCAEILQYEVPNESHVSSWREGLHAKIYGKTARFGTEEFGKLLRNYSAITDIPCVNFPEELIEAFPDAKVVLQTREVESWMASVERTIFQILEWESFRWWRVLAALDMDQTYIIQEHLKENLTALSGSHWTDRSALKKALLTRPEYIRTLVPASNLLEWNVAEGWEPLCKFLNKPIPDAPFPHENPGTTIARHMWDVGVIRVRGVLGDRREWPGLVVALGGLLAVMVGVWIYPIGATLVIDEYLGMGK